MKCIIFIASFTFALSSSNAYAQKVSAYKSADYTLMVQELNSRLKSPWGMTFLPDKRLLVTEKNGTILIISADGKTIEQRIENLPVVVDRGQGGLLDVVLDPDVSNNNTIYWSYTEAGKGKDKNLIWLTADDKKIPALMKFSIPVGTGQIALSSATGI